MMTINGLRKRMEKEDTIACKLEALLENNGANLDAMPAVMTIAQLAFLLQISDGTARKLITQPDFFPKFRIGSCTRISRGALVDWIAEQCRRELSRSTEAQVVIILPRLRNCRMGVDGVNHLLDPHPNSQVRKDLHDAALIGEGHLLQHRQILHHSIVHNEFYNLVYKVDLPAVQVGYIWFFTAYEKVCLSFVKSAPFSVPFVSYETVADGSHTRPLA